MSSPIQNLQESITGARHKVLDRMLVAAAIFGALTAALTLWRDLNFGVSILNSVINFFLVGMITIVMLFRNRITILPKVIVLFASFSLVAIKAFLILGPYSNWIIFMSISCVIIAVTMSTRSSMIIAALLSLTLPVTAFLYHNGIITFTLDQSDLELFNISWIMNIWLAYFLCAFVIIMGVGQLQKELIANFGETGNMVIQLKKANKDLEEQIKIRNEYQDQLEISNNKFRALFESSRDAVVLLDKELNIVEANAVVYEGTGFEKEDIIGRNTFEIIPTENQESHKQRLKQILSGKRTEPLETVIIRKDGTKMPVEFNSTLISSEGEPYILSSVRDVSYRRKIENEKLNAVIRAEEQERERFAKDLHDDLGPVFSTVKLYLQALLKSETDENRKGITRKTMEIVDAAVKQVRHIAHNMSPYLLRDEGLKAAIDAHLSDLNNIHQFSARLNYDLRKPERLPHAVELTFYRIYLELINNTIKHAASDDVRIEVYSSGKEVILDYSDNGQGFDPEAVTEEYGIGIKNIRSRVNALKGEIMFNYKSNRMHTIVSIPL